MRPTGVPSDTRRFRASPAYELILLERLPGDARERVRRLVGDTLAYGAFVRRCGDLGDPIPASRGGALLFLTLQTSGPLPGYLTEDPDRRVCDDVRGLVLDGVIEAWADGQFRGGPAAAATLASAQARGDGGLLARLSRDALAYGARLPGLAREPLAARLYAYGRLPPPAAWRTSPGDYSKAGPPEDITCRLGAGWRGGTDQVPAFGHWRSWIGPGCHESTRFTRNAKLYVSPAPEAFEAAFAAVVGVLAGATRISGFKVSTGVLGARRPDKMIIYAPAVEDLRPVARALSDALAGTAVHGVPFTEQITDDCLISAAADPPWGSQTRPQSWRTWVCGVLADALIEARVAGADPIAVALERAQLAGVDVARWAPLDNAWRDGPGAASW